MPAKRSNLGTNKQRPVNLKLDAHDLVRRFTMARDCHMTVETSNGLAKRSNCGALDVRLVNLKEAIQDLDFVRRLRASLS